MARKASSNKNGGHFWLLEEFLGIIKKYGYSRIIFSTIVMVFIGYGTYLTLHPQVLFERYSRYEENRHTKSFEKRIDNYPMIKSNIEQLVVDTKSYRSFIIEMHNGKYNSAGLSFNYGSLTYEALCDSAETVKEDYTDFSLERYPLTLKVYYDGYYFGSIEDLKKYDNRLALRMESNGVSYIAVSIIYGSSENIGFIGVTYKDKPTINESDIKQTLTKYASKMSILLDGYKDKN